MPSVKHDSDDSMDYKFYHVFEHTIKVAVKAKNDAHILLLSKDGDHKIEIFLGMSSNTKSGIRLNGDKDVVEVDTPDLLDPEDSKDFLIKWNSEGKVKVFKKKDDEPFMEWKNDDPFVITKFGLRTAWGSSGSFKIDGEREVDTPDDMEYKLFRVHSGELNFKVKAKNDAHVIITEEKEDGSPCYEVFFGGWSNTKSAIRINKTKPNVCEEEKEVLESDEFKKFWVKWNYKKITAGKSGHKAFLKYDLEHPGNFSTLYFGIRTGWGSAGEWKLNCKK